jgi:hypothetical protein
MNPTQRCDEIIRMIDEVLDAVVDTDAHAGLPRIHPPSLDRHLVALTSESAP